MLTMRGIRKIYQVGDEEVKALDGVDLAVRDHEFVAIIGASGSGKSTLMNIIGCLDTADEGTYEIDGQDVSSLSEHDQAVLRNRKIGFIFQQFNLLPKLTAFENVELPLIYQGVPASERRERSRQALLRVGLGERMNHKPNQMSGGQQQRVAVARALVTNPSLILADEPTGNLDSHSTQDIMDLLKELNAAGNTLILITHDNEIAAAAPRRVRLKDGRVIWDTALNGEEPQAQGMNPQDQKTGFVKNRTIEKENARMPGVTSGYQETEASQNRTAEKTGSAAQKDDSREAGHETQE